MSQTEDKAGLQESVRPIRCTHRGLEVILFGILQETMRCPSHGCSSKQDRHGRKQTPSIDSETVTRGFLFDGFDFITATFISTWRGRRLGLIIVDGFKVALVAG